MIVRRSLGATLGRDSRFCARIAATLDQPRRSVKALAGPGGELTEIYLQGRRALELENRGGAPGWVDEIEIIDEQRLL